METVTEDYVSFEVAKLLKDKGFPQEYDIYHSMVYNEEDYENEYEVQRMVLETRLVKAGTLSSYPIGVPEPKCYCPTLQMAMKWLRTKGIYIYIQPTKYVGGSLYGFQAIVEDGRNDGWKKSIHHAENYEESVEAALKYSLENLI